MHSRLAWRSQRQKTVGLMINSYKQTLQSLDLGLCFVSQLYKEVNSPSRREVSTQRLLWVALGELLTDEEGRVFTESSSSC